MGQLSWGTHRQKPPPASVLAAWGALLCPRARPLPPRPVGGPLGVAARSWTPSLDASSYKRWDPLRGPKTPRVLKKKSPTPSGRSGGPPGREEPGWLGGGGLRFVLHSLTRHSLPHLFTLLHTHSFTHSQASLQGRGPGLLLRKLLAESPQGGPPSPQPGSTRGAGTNRFLF